MISQEFKQELGSYLKKQASALLAHQSSLASYYSVRTGELKRSLGSGSTIKINTTGESVGVDLGYPKQIRFLDMKKGRNGKRKKKYLAIYNKYAYGYLKADVRRKLNEVVPGQMVREIEDNIKNIK